MALDPNRWTLKTQESFNAAAEMARAASNPEVTPDHLIAALLGQTEGVVLPIIEKVGAQPLAIRNAALARLDKLPKAYGGESRLGRDLQQVLDAADGNLDPNGTTNAYAKSARIGGAEIYQSCRVTDLQMRKDGTWDVITENGNIHAEHVVNCGGLWAREVGRMVGIELPVLAMEHMYLVTEDMPDELPPDDPRSPHLGVYHWLTWVQDTLVDAMMP